MQGSELRLPAGDCPEGRALPKPRQAPRASGAFPGRGTQRGAGAEIPTPPVFLYETCERFAGHGAEPRSSPRWTAG